MTTGEAPVTLSLFDNPTADDATVVRSGSREPSPYNHFPYAQQSATSQRHGVPAQHQQQIGNGKR